MKEVPERDPSFCGVMSMRFSNVLKFGCFLGLGNCRIIPRVVMTLMLNTLHHVRYLKEENPISCFKLVVFEVGFIR
jgi:hypothetical protein